MPEMPIEIKPTPTLNLDILGSKLQRTYLDLMDQQLKAFNSSEKLIRIKNDLEDARLNGLADGSIVGKNAAEREACAKKLLAPFFEALEKAQSQDRYEKFQLERCTYALNMYRSLLHVYELGDWDRDERGF